jgi:hypothetical protein
MAELILTPEEKDAALWRDLSDDAVGKLCKLGLATFDKVDKERDFIHGYSAALMFVMKAIEANATRYVQTLNGLTKQGKELGDWKITCEKKGEGERRVVGCIDVLDILEAAVKRIQGQNHFTQLQEYENAFNSLLELIKTELEGNAFDRLSKLISDEQGKGQTT